MSRLRRLWENQPKILIVFLVGLIAVCVSAVLEFNGYPHGATVVMGIGCSILAASIVSFLSPVTEDVYQTYQRFLQLGITEVYPSRRDVGNRQWVEWLRSARRQFVVVGIANNNWCTDPDFRAALDDRLRNAVEVKFFFLDPNCDAARTRAQEDAGRDTCAVIRQSIHFMWEFRQKLHEELRKGFTLRVYNATPSLGVTWFDTSMVVTHYVAGSPNVTSPALMVQPGRRQGQGENLYDVYDDSVRRIEKEFSTIIDESNILSYAGTSE